MELNVNVKTVVAFGYVLKCVLVFFNNPLWETHNDARAGEQSSGF